MTALNLDKSISWSAPPDWKKITTIDAHTAGEPLRIVIAGFPKLSGDSILARRKVARQRYDSLRQGLMWEPRGHADMYGCILTPAISPDADFGVLFTHNEGYSTMCGHGIIAVTTVVLETGMLAKQKPVTSIRIDTPAGLISAFARIEDNRVQSVYFHNVPAFVCAQNQHITVDGLGKIRYDIAFGGAFYALLQAEDFGLDCSVSSLQQLISYGKLIKAAVAAETDLQHPFEPDLNFLYGTIFISPAQQTGAHSRNVCVFADGEVDRSPTGTGVSARLALLYHRDEIAFDEVIRIESIIGSIFTGSVIKKIAYGPYQAIISQVEGSAHIIAKNEFLIDPKDPMPSGFLLR